jgi:hypothetical protein
VVVALFFIPVGQPHIFKSTNVNDLAFSANFLLLPQCIKQVHIPVTVLKTK